MKKYTLILTVLIFISCSNNTNKVSDTNKQKIKVETNKNVETLSIIWCLAAQDDFKNDDLFNSSAHLLKHILKKFNKNKNHPAVQKAKFLYDNDIMNITHAQIGVQFTNLPEFKVIDDLELEIHYIKEEIDHINQFYSLVPSFFVEAKIDSFLTAEKDLYQKILFEVKKSLPTYENISYLEDFHGIKMNGYIIIPSPAIPNYLNYGQSVKVNESYNIYYLKGPSDDIKIFNSQLPDSLGFEDKEYMEVICRHEFGHSFVRFFDNPHNMELIESISFLDSESLEEGQERYGEWQGIFEEHIVRAIEIRIAEIMNDSILSTELYEDYVNKRKFLYIPEIIDVIKEYEMNRDKYPTFEDFFPIIIAKMEKFEKV